MRDLIATIRDTLGPMLELAIFLIAIFGMILAFRIFEIGVRWVESLS